VKKYKLISEDTIKNLIEFLEEIHFDAISNNKKDDMHIANFCNWMMQELINGTSLIDTNSTKKTNKSSKKKSRQDYVDETFIDWNLPEMTDDEYEKLVDQFDAFLRGWEKEYYKKNYKKKPKHNNKTKKVSLKEIETYLKDDPELTPEERFELYYDEHERVKEEKDTHTLKDILKDLNLNYKPNKKSN